LTQLRIQQKLNAKQTQFLKSRNFYQRGVYIYVSQRVSCARQVPQALSVHLDLEDTKEPGDEEDRKEGLDTREIKVLWDRQERAASKALWDLLDYRERLETKARKETWDLQVCRELKAIPVNRYHLLLLLFLL